MPRGEPEEGQVVSVRGKLWAVRSVVSSPGSAKEAVNRVTLEALSEDSLGHTVDLIWEREIRPRVLEATALPPVESTDAPEAFDAFLSAIRWSSQSAVEGNVFQAPFRGGVQIEEYQLAPVLRALQMPRVTLLIADDVGLGKTIEAGLVAQELIHSHRATRVLVVCPAHLQTKWADEMQQKFGLEFRIINRDSVETMRREFGPTINPWASFPRLITSIDYLKREYPRSLFMSLAFSRKEERTGRPWDMLILDEAHNAAPTGRGKYIRSSDRTKLLREIAGLFEHRLFLTATPHNGYRESFTGLLELLDNLRFSRGTELNREHLKAVTIRRLKEKITYPDGRRRFPRRVVLPVDETTNPDLYVTLTPKESKLFELLDLYSRSLQAKSESSNVRAAQFVLTLLKKRALSSPMALRESLVTHSETVGVKDDLGIGDHIFRQLESRQEEDYEDDAEKEQTTTEAIEQASRLVNNLSDEERGWLQEMFELSDGLRQTPDSKAKALLRWLKKHLCPEGIWGTERVIIFSEYVHTLEYLRTILSDAGMGKHLAVIFGGMPDKDRQKVNDEFLSDSAETPVRILLATDAASEGSDFQKQCRNVIHYDIPWNPMRLEQRNGRVDRHGQPAEEVRIHHFVYRNHEDSDFLKRVVEKVEAIRDDLGSVGALIADNVRQHALGQTVDLEAIDRDARRQIARDEFRIDIDVAAEAKVMIEALNAARASLGISEASQMELLRQALKLEGLADQIISRDDSTFEMISVPRHWRDCQKYISRAGAPQRLTFDREISRNNRGVGIVHLDHPLMRRAIGTLRSQMWRSGGSANGKALSCVTAYDVNQIKAPVIVAWGWLMLMGPDKNRLHEGLINVAVEVNGAEYTTLTDEGIGNLLKTGRQPYAGDIDRLRPIASPSREFLLKLLKERGNSRAGELKDALAARGATAERSVRSLMTERMAEIRKALKRWQDISNDRQLKLFTDEQEELATDIRMLEKRLADLEVERETEPVIQRKRHNVTEVRVYPVALQIFMPGRGN